VKKILPALIPRWLPALLMMAAIFYFSSQPGDSLPDFLSWDRVVKKGGHAAGYGFLALAYSHWLGRDKKYDWLAWTMTVIYAATDEFHQSFVAGRSASIFDVIIFDNLGAAFALWLYSIYRRKNEQETDAA
jgi:VanZ family protein